MEVSRLARTSRRLPRKLCVRRYKPVVRVGDFRDQKTTVFEMSHTCKQFFEKIPNLIRTKVHAESILLCPLCLAAHFVQVKEMVQKQYAEAGLRYTDHASRRLKESLVVWYRAGSSLTGSLPSAIWQSWRLGLIGLAYQARHMVIVISGKLFGGRDLIKRPESGRAVSGQMDRYHEGIEDII